MVEKFEIKSAEDMEGLGRKIAEAARSGLIIYLIGQLGAGKTTFARGFLRGFGYKDHVRSPTYNLFEIYDVGDQSICHIDLYRLKDPSEINYFGVIDYFDGKNIFLIEWPEKGEGFLSKADILCRFSLVDDPDVRVVEIEKID